MELTKGMQIALCLQEEEEEDNWNNKKKRERKKIRFQIPSVLLAAAGKIFATPSTRLTMKRQKHQRQIELH